MKFPTAIFIPGPGAGWRAALALFLLVSSPPAWCADVVPKACPPERYESLWKHSPFTLSSVEDAAPAGMASHLALVGAAKVGAIPYAIILDKQSQERSLVSLKPNDKGMSLTSLQIDSDFGKTMATLQLGGETAVLHFDATASVPPPNNPNQPNVPNPAVQPYQPANPNQSPQPNPAYPNRVLTLPPGSPPAPGRMIPRRRIVIPATPNNPNP